MICIRKSEYTFVDYFFVESTSRDVEWYWDLELCLNNLILHLDNEHKAVFNLSQIHSLINLAMVQHRKNGSLLPLVS